MSAGIRLKLPATSANVGPGFDAAGLALSMHLTVEAHVAPAMAIEATGRDAELCGVLEANLIVETYGDVMAAAGKKRSALHLRLHNEIPLGMGCGSSAAAILAGIALADHFGALHLTDEQIVTEASRIEGHPDNVAACWYGGFTTSVQTQRGVVAATFAGNPAWQMMLALQLTALATKSARALLPETYAKADAVFNVQRASLLVAAFAQHRLELLTAATGDKLHQPYRMQACPLLEPLLPLAGGAEIAAVTLSGAGPSVLLFLQPQATVLTAEAAIRERVPAKTELLHVRIGGGTERTVLAE